MADSTIVRWTFIIVLGQVQNHKGWSEAYRQASPKLLENYWIRVEPSFITSACGLCNQY